MSSLFFAKIFCVFVFVVCVFCGTAHAAETAAAETVKKINIFNSGQIDKIIPPEGGAATNNIEIESFYSPVLLSTDDVIIAVIGANSNKDSETRIDILTRYTVKKDDDEWINEAFDPSKTETSWNTQFALQEDNQKKVLKSLAATARGNKIYILVINQSTNLSGKEWEFSFVEGTVTNDQGTGVQKKKITWQKSQLSDLSVDGKFKKDVSDNYPQFLSAFVTTDETVVFFVKEKTQETSKSVFAIIKPKTTNTVSEVVSIADVDESCNPNFFLWGSKVVMIPTSCKDVTGQQIKGFDVAADKLNEDKKFSGRVWDFLKDKKDITTATINTTPAVLFTQKASKSK